MEEKRPNPESILEQIQSQQRKSERGKLKIFFGYAAGVGKSYSMLKAAQDAKRSGKDIIAGYVEPHTRPETTMLLDGLEVMPVKSFNYHNIILYEPDIDTIIIRHPEIVLMDEFAHTNAKGSRHEKRYQDIEELINAGISVYTTVNVQHLESLCDIVASITGVVVMERIPDRLFDMADEVQLVDVEPGELIERLKNGKIYKNIQADKALNHFFTEEKLTALRELALRRTADRVNRISEKAKKENASAYFTDERIMVGLSSSPSNTKIIRTASRMSSAFKAEFFAVYVETEETQQMSTENKKRLQDNIHLAEQLGAKIETINGSDIALVLAEFAKLFNISKMVLGRSTTKRKLFKRSSFSDKIIELAPDLDIYIIPDGKNDRNATKFYTGRTKLSLSKISWKDAACSLSIIVAATMIGLLFYHLGFSEANIITVYILGTMLSGILASNPLFPLISSILSVAVFNFMFTEPRFSLQAYDPGYPVTFLIMFLAALLSSNVTMKMKQQAQELSRGAYRTKVMLDTNQLLQGEKTEQEIGNIIGVQLKKLLQRNIVIYPEGKGMLLEPEIITCDESEVTPELKEAYINQNERAVAVWVYKNRKRAGVSTGTLGNANCYYLSIRDARKAYGVIGIGMKQGEYLQPFENNIVFAILTEGAAAMERERLRLERENATQQANSEKLRANLLRAISHDLRTPLTSISGNTDMLLRNEFDREKRLKIYSDIYEDSMWLINLVENLLAVTRIENGSMRLYFHSEILVDIVEEALHHCNRKTELYQIEVHLEDDLQMVRVNSRMIIQVFINIIDNAIKYSSVGSKIVILSKKQGKDIVISIADTGEGIPDIEKERIFDMFYTANTKVADSKRSLGLGLALCKSIVLAHNGKIWVEDSFPKGATFKFTLPGEEVEIHE
ncbi:MAG: sensor histidine kinase KdpD [Lachnospiraceae bacterium]|nr:sensor histidine kinase KdpD [Lachnospiraceae bacterium]